MATPRLPLGPRPIRLADLTDDDFELLCALIVLLEEPRARRLRAPERGADAALPDGGSAAYARCWQFKRYGGTIHWSKCKDSLDRAVDAYAMPHYTFCFARDLTGAQEKLFNKHLVGRHEGVLVDYWNETRLTAALLGSDQGERILRHFYGDPEVDTRALMAALRAGGALENAEDAGRMLGSIAEFIARHDPFFSYPASVREASDPRPLPWPGSVMAVEVVSEQATERLEAIPRNPEALHQFSPAWRFEFEDSDEGRAASEALHRILREGGEAELGTGARLEWERLPPLFMERFGQVEEGTSFTVKAGGPIPRAPEPWRARFKANLEEGRDVAFDLDLLPVTPPAGWAGALEGTRGGFTMTAQFRPHDTGGGEAVWNWKFRSEAGGLSFREQLDVVELATAMHQTGVLTIEDLDGKRPPFELDLQGRAAPDWLPYLRRLLEDLVTIEDWTGRTFKRPDVIPASEVAAIAEAAFIIRSRSSRMNFDHIELELPPDQVANLASDPQPRVELAVTTVTELLGEQVVIGRLAGVVPHYKIAEQRPGSDGLVLVRIEPATDESRNPIFELLPE